MAKKVRIEESERKTQRADAVADYDGSISNSAKLVDAIGDDFVESEAAPVTVEGKFSNFWYHYKWHTIIGLCVLVFLFVGVTQLKNNNPSDITVMFAGPMEIGTVEKEQMSSALTEILKSDPNGNGKKKADLYPLAVYTESQITELVEYKKEHGGTYPYYDRTEVEASYRSFSDHVLIGDYGVMLISPELFEEVKKEGGFVPLSEVLGSTPNEAVDEYGIRFRDTKFAKYYSVFDKLPENTVLCLRKTSQATGIFNSKKSAEKTYENNKNFFVEIMSFEYPEGYEETE